MKKKKKIKIKKKKKFKIAFPLCFSFPLKSSSLSVDSTLASFQRVSARATTESSDTFHVVIRFFHCCTMQREVDLAASMLLSSVYSHQWISPSKRTAQAMSPTALKSSLSSRLLLKDLKIKIMIKIIIN